jgi:hypothetical protein
MLFPNNRGVEVFVGVFVHCGHRILEAHPEIGGIRLVPLEELLANKILCLLIDLAMKAPELLGEVAVLVLNVGDLLRKDGRGWGGILAPVYDLLYF